MCFAVASHHSLSQLHACSPFQFERNSVASFLYCCVQWVDIKTHCSLNIVFLYPKWPILFFVLHPDNFSRAGGSSHRVKRLRLWWLKIIKEMHRKIKSALKSKIHESFEKEIKNLSNFSFFWIKPKGQNNSTLQTFNFINLFLKTKKAP